MQHSGSSTAGHAGSSRVGTRVTTAVRIAALACAFSLLASFAWATAEVENAGPGEVTITHYFGGDLGRAGLEEIFASFKEQTGITVVDSPIGHEDFKDGILVRAAGGNLPDVFSYWAGARTQFVVDGGSLATIDTMWASHGLGAVVAKSVADGATNYNSSRYLVPFGYHYAGMFYNAKVMAEAGVTEFPTDWDGFLALCENLKAQGITPNRARLEVPLAGPVLVRLPAAAHRRTRLPRQPDGRRSLLHRPRGAAGHGAVEGPRRCRLLRPQRQRRRLDRRFRQGGARRCGDDPDGHLDHRLLERSGHDGRRRLRLLRVPDDRRRGRQRGGRAGRRLADLGRRREPGQRRGAGRVHGQRSRVAGQVGADPGRAVAQRQRGREHLHLGDDAGAGGGGQRRHLRLQLRPWLPRRRRRSSAWTCSRASWTARTTTCSTSPTPKKVSAACSTVRPAGL